MDKEAHIRSISRSLAVLRAVNNAGSLSMMEIAKAAGVPYPTACRVVFTLQEEGMLEREPSRKHYRPTALVQSLSHGYQDHSDLVGLARDHIEELTRAHYWPVSLTSRVGQFIVVRDCTHALSPMALTNYQPGATFPLLECASGHVMLAFAEEDERRSWLDAAAVGDVPIDRLTLQRLGSNEFVGAIRSNGYALRHNNRFTNTPGRTSSLAVPIFQHGEVHATLTLIYFSVAMREDAAVRRYLPDLTDAATAIARRLEERASGVARAGASQRDVQRAELRVAQ